MKILETGRECVEGGSALAEAVQRTRLMVEENLDQAFLGLSIITGPEALDSHDDIAVCCGAYQDILENADCWRGKDTRGGLFASCYSKGYFYSTPYLLTLGSKVVLSSSTLHDPRSTGSIICIIPEALTTAHPLIRDRVSNAPETGHLISIDEIACLE